MTLASLQQVPQATSPIQSRQMMGASSPGPLDQLISMQDPLSYLQATSPQPAGFSGLNLTRVCDYVCTQLFCPPYPPPQPLLHKKSTKVTAIHSNSEKLLAEEREFN